MKKIKLTYITALLLGLGFSGCVSDEDIELPLMNKVVYFEDFQTVVEGTFDETVWTNYAEAGSKLWIQNSYNSNGYLEFSPFNSEETLNIGWLVSPAISLENAQAKKLTFDVGQHHVINTENNYIQVYISSDFNGDVATTTWTEIENFTKPEIGTANNYDWFGSGVIDLSDFSGTIHIAFKVTGGTASANAGAYMIDNIRVF